MILLLGICIICECSYNDNDIDKKNMKATIESITAMVNKYNADYSWRDSLKCGDFLRPLFSYKLEKHLKSTSNRPIMFFGGLTDIESTDNTFFAVFSYDSYWDYDLSDYLNVVFKLECKKDFIPDLTDSSNFLDFRSGFAVIAAISEVRKIRFGLGINYSEQYDESEYYVETDFYVPKMFWVKGTLVDFLPVNNLSDSLIKYNFRLADSLARLGSPTALRWVH